MPKAFEVPIPSVHLLWALRVLSKKIYDSQHIRHHILSYLTPLQTNQLDEAIDIACATPGAHKIYVTRNVTMSDIDFVGCIEKRKTVLLLSKERPWRLRLLHSKEGPSRDPDLPGALQELAANGHVKFQNLVIEAVESDVNRMQAILRERGRRFDTSRLQAVLRERGRSFVNVDAIGQMPFLKDAIGQN